MKGKNSQPQKQKRRDVRYVPDELLYLPVPQLEHVPPSLPVDPALHLQSLLAVLPAVDLERAGQFEQAPEPVNAHTNSICHVSAANLKSLSGRISERKGVGCKFQNGRISSKIPDELLYVPAGQITHVPPLDPPKPGGQWQSLTEVLPSYEVDPVGQLEHDRTVSLRRRGSSNRIQILQTTHTRSFTSVLERMKQ